jgi:hypothetical protein
VHGSVDLGSEPPVFTARPDVGTTRVILDPASFTLEGIMSGASDVMSIAPGMQIVRLASRKGAIDVALQPAEADALALRFPENVP